MIEIRDVTKTYGAKVAVDHASFTIDKGEVVGFLGRNGAGKTTTMNILTGYIAATSGDVFIDDMDILKDPRDVKRNIGYLPEQPPLYLDMTVTEYLRFVCDIKSVPKMSRTAHISDICDLTRIADVRKRLIKNLSKGYRQRVGLAQALVGNPHYIILDEPTVGLDPKQIIEMRNLIRDLGRDHTVILSSHILTEVADICQRVVIINQGKIVAQDTLENLQRTNEGKNQMIVRISGDEKRVMRTLRDLYGVTSVESVGMHEPDSHDFRIESDASHDVRRALFNEVGKLGHHILMLKPMDVTLEDIFLELTKEKEAI